MSHIQSKKVSEEPKRVQYAVDKLVSLGFTVEVFNQNEVRFEYQGSTIILFPYSGWFSGKGIKDGRGVHNLLKQLK